MGSSLALFAFRASESPAAIRYSFLSREFFMQLNNVVLVSSMVIILWGTLAPIGYEVINGNLYSIGKPFFDFFFVPLMLFLAIAIGFVPVLRWKKTSFDHLRSALKVLLPTTLVLAFLIAYLIDFRSSTVVLCCGFGGWIILTMLAMRLHVFETMDFSVGHILNVFGTYWLCHQYYRRGLHHCVLGRRGRSHGAW